MHIVMPGSRMQNLDLKGRKASPVALVDAYFLWCTGNSITDSKWKCEKGISAKA